VSQPQNLQIELKLPVQAVEIVLGALAELPYKVGAQLISYIQGVAQEQVDAARAPEQAPSAPEAVGSADTPSEG